MLGEARNETTASSQNILEIFLFLPKIIKIGQCLTILTTEEGVFDSHCRSRTQSLYTVADVLQH